jgi:hypothetical protein
VAYLAGPDLCRWACTATCRAGWRRRRRRSNAPMRERGPSASSVSDPGPTPRADRVRCGPRRSP